MRWIVAAAVAAVMLAAAGCGGSSDEGSDAADDVAAITETMATETETTADDTTAADTDTTGAATSGGGLSDDCQDLVEASQAFGAAAASSGSGDDSSLESTASAYKALAEQAPADLRDDFEALADVMTEYAEAIGDLDLQSGETPSAEQIAKLAQIGQSFGAEKVQKASAAIAAWSTANCGGS